MSRDHQRVAALAASIDAHGQHEPPEVTVDRAGRCTPREGHHRLVAMLGLNYLEVAAVFIPVAHRIPSYARPAVQVLAATARTARPTPSA